MRRGGGRLDTDIGDCGPLRNSILRRPTMYSVGRSLVFSGSYRGGVVKCGNAFRSLSPTVVASRNSLMLTGQRRARQNRVKRSRPVRGAASPRGGPRSAATTRRACQPVTATNAKTTPSDTNAVDDDCGSTATPNALWHRANRRPSSCGWSTVTANGLPCDVSTGCGRRGAADPDRSSPQWAAPSTPNTRTGAMTAMAITDRNRDSLRAPFSPTVPRWQRRGRTFWLVRYGWFMV